MNHAPDDWTRWQHAVVDIIRTELAEVMPVVQIDDIHWEYWRPLYQDGSGPKAAVNRALARD